MSRIAMIVTVVGGAMLGLFFGRSQSRVNLVDVHDTFDKAKVDSGVVLLDVRTPAEFDDGYIEGAILIPVQELEQRVRELDQYKDKTIIAYCRSGARSGRAAALLQEKGFTVLNMEGGMLKWRAEDLPVSEKKTE